MKATYKYILAFFLSVAAIQLPAADAEQDVVAPVIEHQVITKAIPAGKAYRFQAKVTDNTQVNSVTLHYRIRGNKAYNIKSMKLTEPSSNQYAAEIGSEEIGGPAMEYYIKAQDSAGNTLLHGGASSPLVVKVQSLLSENDIETDSGQLLPSRAVKAKPGLLQNKWFWIGMGVVLGGVAYAGREENSNKPTLGPNTDSGNSTLDITISVP